MMNLKFSRLKNVEKAADFYILNKKKCNSTLILFKRLIA